MSRRKRWVIAGAAAGVGLAVLVALLVARHGCQRGIEVEGDDVTDGPQAVEAQHDEVIEAWAGKRPPGEEHADLLRPEEEEKLRRAFYAVLDDMREKKVRPEVTVQVRGGYLGKAPTHYYTIDLPLQYRRFHSACSRGNCLAGYYWALCQQALYTPEYPYYVTVLVLAPKFKELHELPALTERKPELWDELHTDTVPGETSFSLPAPFSVPYWKDAPPVWWHYEKYCRVRESLDSTVSLKSENGEYGLPSHDGDGRWWTFPLYRRWQGRRWRMYDGGVLGRTGDAIVETDAKTHTALIKVLPQDKTQQDALVSFFCSASDKDSPPKIHPVTAKDLLLVTQTIAEYFRATSKPTPLYTDMATALFVSRGYDFDRETGKYTLNKAGERLLDYVIEHPRSNVIGHLAILHDHGCAEFLDKLIQKHHPKLKTWEQFRRAYTAPRKPQPQQDER